MDRQEKFVEGGSIPEEVVGKGVSRRVLGHDDQLMMIQVRFEKGGVGSLHRHPHRQVSYVAAGKFSATIGGEERVLNAGDSFFVPPDTEHGVVALEAGVLIDVFAPAREDFLPRT